jgi:hypothetical protein
LAGAVFFYQLQKIMKFKQIKLFTNDNGFAEFGEEWIELDQGSEQARLSALMQSGGYQLRHSPVGFRSEFHVSPHPQWVFILSGQMQIGLQDGSSKTFSPGEHFYSADLLPQGASFDPKMHGHWSRQVGDSPLVTLFVRG